MTDYIIRVEDLVKRFGSLAAVDGIAPIRQVMLGEMSDSASAISVFGHTISLWDNIMVLAAFGVVMLLLAMWSFSNQD